MTTLTPPSLPQDWTVADLIERLGGIPPSRIRMLPVPGTATEQDVVRAEGRTGGVCELIDGVLVEKAVGYLESLLAAVIVEALRKYNRGRNLGIVLSEAGTLRILPGQVRAPDVSFIRWERFPNGKLVQTPIPRVAPDLAVEVLSEGNTAAEMDRKLQEYFQAGTRLVWYIDPRARAVRVYTSPGEPTTLTANDVLTGGDVLPGFELSLASLFAEIDGALPEA